MGKHTHRPIGFSNLIELFDSNVSLSSSAENFPWLASPYLRVSLTHSILIKPSVVCVCFVCCLLWSLVDCVHHPIISIHYDAATISFGRWHHTMSRPFRCIMIRLFLFKVEVNSIDQSYQVPTLISLINEDKKNGYIDNLEVDGVACFCLSTKLIYNVCILPFFFILYFILT